eukprot:gene555-1068_t
MELFLIVIFVIIQSSHVLCDKNDENIVLDPGAGVAIMSWPRDGEVIVAQKKGDLYDISFSFYGIVMKGESYSYENDLRDYLMIGDIGNVKISMQFTRKGNLPICFQDRVKTIISLNITQQRILPIHFEIFDQRTGSIIGSHSAHLVIITKEEFFHRYPDRFPTISPDVRALDFIEIGTCYFETAAHNAFSMYNELNLITNGISIEPVKRHLDSLPDSPGVLKVNAAIDSSMGVADVYYFPVYDITDGYFMGVEGATMINAISPDAAKHMVGVKHGHALLQKESIRAITLSYILDRYAQHITEPIRLLKIDAEGYDGIIISDLLDYYANNIALHPCVINFESMWLPEKELNALLQRLRDARYVVHMNDVINHVAINYNCSYHTIKRAELMLYPTVINWVNASKAAEEASSYLTNYWPQNFPI